MITRDRKYGTGPVSSSLLRSVLEEFLRGVPRCSELRSAFMNRRAIAERRREDGLPNHRLAHAFPRYIATMASGYLLGKPVMYADDTQQAALSELEKAYTRTDTASVDAELAMQAAVYGRGIEILFADEDAHPRCATLPPENAFVVYENTVQRKPLFGVHFSQVRRLDGTEEGYLIHVCTDRFRYTCSVPSLLMQDYGTFLAEPHYFGGVPMIEYWNDQDETGDFEQVLGLIDAYDVLESDRVNDKEQFVDALLVITGARLETDEQGRSPGKQLRQDKLLYLPDSEASASYLARSMAESDVEILKNALRDDIHKFSMVPDLTDEKFAGNTSGVAMKFKLLGLEQLVRIKERWFREALRERMRRFSCFLAMQGMPELDADRVSMIFTRSLPANELEISQTIMNYAGFVPEELLLTQVPFVENAQRALDMRKKERGENAAQEEENKREPQ